MGYYPTGDKRVMSWDAVVAAAHLGGFTWGQAPVIAAITMPEAGRQPGIVQSGQPYATTGWGLTQITPGNSEPQIGIDNALLNPVTNMRAAHAKFTAAGGWSPWTADVVADDVMAGVPFANIPWVPDALAAAHRVSGLSVGQLERLAGSSMNLSSVPSAKRESWGRQVGGTATKLDGMARSTREHLKYINWIVSVIGG